MVFSTEANGWRFYNDKNLKSDMKEHIMHLAIVCVMDLLPKFFKLLPTDDELMENHYIDKLDDDQTASYLMQIGGANILGEMLKKEIHKYKDYGEPNYHYKLKTGTDNCQDIVYKRFIKKYQKKSCDKCENKIQCELTK